MANRRPSIYIGLGGTGIKAIAQTKKLYEDEFGIGNIPPEIAFLGIDFDNKSVEENLPTDVKGDFLQLVTAVNPREHYRVQHEQYNEFNWMFPSNTSYIDEKVYNGAKQVRTTGRLYTEIVLQQIRARLTKCFQQVQSIANARGYNQPVDVHLSMSVAGGTGAGSFLTIALLVDQLKESLGPMNLYGYAVLHGVFRAMDTMGNKTPRVITNSYSAIMDLDYLLHASDDNPVEVMLGFERRRLTSPIFKEFYVIDNVTTTHKVVEKCQQLCEVLGTCLYVSGNEIGNDKDSAASNVGWREGGFNVLTKKGWVHGLGACQVVYKGKELADTYAYKAAKELVRKMLQEGEDISQKALDWTEEVKVREDGATYNMLIDSILDPTVITKIKMPLLDVKASESANQGVVMKDIDTYVPEMPTVDELQKRTDSLCESVKSRIDGYLAGENGVGNAVAFLASLKRRCQGYKNEMASEMAVFTKKADERLEALPKAWKEYDADKKGALTFKRDEKNQELLEDYVGRPVIAIRKDRHEAKRREHAYNIFGSLITYIESLENKVNDLAQKLKALVANYEEELEQRQRETKSSLIFEYDLSYKDRVNMSVDSSEIIVSEFTASLGKSLLEVDVESLGTKIYSYTEKLPKADSYRNKLIMDVIDDMSDDEYKHLVSEIEVLSGLLLRLDSRGQTIEGVSVVDKMVSSYMIASYGTENIQSRFQRDPYFLSNVTDKSWPKSTAEVMKQKVIFYRVGGAILPYCIGAFDPFTVNTEYERQIQQAMAPGAIKFNPHFDAEIFAKMKSTDFKLKPEMQNEAMFYWVCGQIFGWDAIAEQTREMKKDDKGFILAEDRGRGEVVEHSKYISCIKGTYYFWDEEAMAGKMKKWNPIDGAGTSRRDKAFNYFKTVILPQKKNLFYNLIKSQFAKFGNEKWRNDIEGLASEGLDDYINKLLCTNKSSVTYNSSESGEIKLIREEFDYLSKSLYNSLLNLK